MLLAIDTASNSVSVALLTAEKVVAERFEKMERGQGEVLIPMIQELVGQAGITMNEISSVAVSVGPGSFTGVRVGLSAARAIGLALSVPVMGVTTFEMAAFGLDKPLAVILDTKRGDYYTQFFAADGTTDEAMVRSAEELKAFLPFVAVGDGASELSAQIGCTVVENKQTPAVCVGQVALRRLDNPMPAEPVYLRGADVTV